MRFVLQHKGEQCKKSHLSNPLNVCCMDIFPEKKKSPFGSEHHGYFGLVVILFIYNPSIHSSLKVRVTSSCALRAPEDKHQDICSSHCPPSLFIYIGYLFY